MPTGQRRFEQTRQMHFIAFSCYRRQPKLGTEHVRSAFAHSLERTRRAYEFYGAGYVVMPEHVHLLITAREEWMANENVSDKREKLSALIGLLLCVPVYFVVAHFRNSGEARAAAIYFGVSLLSSRHSGASEESYGIGQQ